MRSTSRTSSSVLALDRVGRWLAEVGAHEALQLEELGGGQGELGVADIVVGREQRLHGKAMRATGWTAVRKLAVRRYRSRVLRARRADDCDDGGGDGGQPPAHLLCASTRRRGSTGESGRRAALAG